MTRMGWEIYFSDESGVDYAVRYENKTNDPEMGVIEFENVDKVQFSQDKLDWLIECLQKIKTEIMFQ